mmetsp:Transcript_2174/g.4999  ORF Transcript_2174/g.4999 Transcript_2174/m.4999 type:complete len:437 (+) Transcript_2174:347-1657(+)
MAPCRPWCVRWLCTRSTSSCKRSGSRRCTACSNFQKTLQKPWLQMLFPLFSALSCFTAKKMDCPVKLHQRALAVLDLFVSRLAQTPNLPELVSASGGLDGVIRVTSSFSSDPSVTGLACAIMASVVRENVGAQNLAGSSSAAEAVVAALTQSHSLQTSQNGCFALAALAFRHVGNQDRVGAAGGVEAVVKTMMAFPSDQAVQRHGCAALGNLSCQHPDNQQRLGAVGGVECIVAALSRFVDDLEVVHNANGALGYAVFQHEENQAKGIAAGGVEATIRVMVAHAGVEDVERVGCFSLRCLAALGEASAQQVRTAGQKLIVGLEKHGADSVRLQASMLLEFLNEGRGLELALLNMLPTFTAGEERPGAAGGASAEECSICLQATQPGETMRRLPCLHAFHAACADQWLKTSGSCPQCRGDILQLVSAGDEDNSKLLV